MIKGIRQSFQNRTARHQEEKLFASKLAVLADAVDQGDNKTFSALFAGVKESSLFTTDVSDKLLKTALFKDNASAFNTILATYDDPNIWSSRTLISASYRGTSAPVITENEHILGLALRTGSENVALALVKNKKVFIDSSGFTEKVYFPPKEATITPYPTPVELAREQGLRVVGAALEMQVAVQKAIQARKFNGPQV